jgi:hypothetical protein
LVDDRTRLTNRLQALLKQYFPQALDWAGELDTVRALDFLAQWPQLEALQLATPEQLRNFYQQPDVGTVFVNERVGTS